MIRSLQRRTVRSTHHSWGAVALRAQGGHFTVIKGTAALDPPEGSYAALVGASVYRNPPAGAVPDTRSRVMPINQLRRDLGTNVRLVDTAAHNGRPLALVATQTGEETVALVPLEWLAAYLTARDIPTTVTDLQEMPQEPQPLP